MISWAAGKGVKGKEWKDYWDLDTGISYIPFNKLNNSTDFESLEEGGMFDEDSMPTWLKEKMKSSTQKKDVMPMDPGQMFQMNMTGRVDTTQPPPSGQIMPGMPMVPPFMGPVPRLMTPMGLMAPNLVPGLSIGVPPPPMMIQTTAMVPGMPPIPMDKSVPPPSTTNQPAFMNFPPMQQHQMSHLPPVSIASNSDDHMDIEMDDEPSAKVVSSAPTNVGMFNRPPPPQMFDQSMPPIPANLPQNYGKDHNDRDRRQGKNILAFQLFDQLSKRVHSNRT